MITQLVTSASSSRRRQEEDCGNATESLGGIPRGSEEWNSKDGTEAQTASRDQSEARQKSGQGASQRKLARRRGLRKRRRAWPASLQKAEPESPGRLLIATALRRTLSRPPGQIPIMGFPGFNRLTEPLSDWQTS